ncbi:MAG: MarR family transcriptional regulator [Gammaproteobacteria bacterium]|jgi:DNA-binding MarR family transcriptional regulator
MNDTIERQVLSAIRRLIRATDSNAKKLARRTNLSISQLLVLELLGERAELTIGGIAERVGLAQATVTGIVDTLARRSLVARQRGNDDRRVVEVSVTRKGREFLDKAPVALQTRFLRNFAALRGWEKMAILSSLERLADLMEVEDVEASPILDVGTLDV